MAPTGVGLACDVTKAVFLDEESGVDVPDGDIPNFFKFPKVFSLFRAISLFRIIKMPCVPHRLPAGGDNCCFCLVSPVAPLLGNQCWSFPPGGPPAVGCITFYFYTHSFLGYFLLFTSGSPFRL